MNLIDVMKHIEKKLKSNREQMVSHGKVHLKTSIMMSRLAKSLKNNTKASQLISEE